MPRGRQEEAESQWRTGVPWRYCLAGLLPESGWVSPRLPPKSYTHLPRAVHVASRSDTETVEGDSLPEGGGLGTGSHTVCPSEGPRSSLGKLEAFISSLQWGREEFVDVCSLLCILDTLYLLILAQTWQVLLLPPFLLRKQLKLPELVPMGCGSHNTRQRWDL